jgi:hypothetical protein
MKQREPELAAEVAKWFAEAEARDAAEDDELGAEHRGDELPQWVANKQRRLEKMRAAMAALEAEAQQAAEAQEAAQKESEDQHSEAPRGGGAGRSKGSSARRKAKPRGKAPPDKAQRNFTDPDSRIMKDSHGFEQCYNAQAAVDAQSQVIVAEGLTNAGNDKQQLEPMVDAIEQQTGRVPRELSADSGYCSEENLEKLDKRRIRGYIATGRQKHGQASATGKDGKHGGARVQAMATRLRRGGYRSRYRLRKQTVEPVFGQIKGARGFRQFLLRGVEKVAGEWRLICTAHNLLKLAGAVSCTT